MGNFFPQGCNYTYQLGWNSDIRIPAYMDIKLFPGDPYGAPNCHNNCTHPNSSTCYSTVTADGIQNECQYIGGNTVFSDPPIGVINGYQLGIGLVRPTLKDRGYNGPSFTNVYPLDRKPVRSNHNGVWGGVYGLPLGWYLLYRIQPASVSASTVYVDPLYRYNYTYITTADNRNLATTFYYKDGLNASATWLYGGSTTQGTTNAFHAYGYINGWYKWDICATNAYINSASMSTRYIFSDSCTTCA
jgi:hypothetical protein